MFKLLRILAGVVIGYPLTAIVAAIVAKAVMR